MRNLSTAGRIFYGIAMAGMGLQTIYYHDFPYMMIPPRHSWIPGLAFIAYFMGTLFTLAGVGIVFARKARPIALLLGMVLLLIFCFYHLPYRLMTPSSYVHFIVWENAAKELALAGGAFVIAGCFAAKNENSLSRFLAKLIPWGVIIFSIPMISFGIDHFLYASGVAEYIPAWVPNKLFWSYFAGTALLGSNIAILLNLKRRLAAVLLGSMIFIWVIILHIPKVIAAPGPEMAGETTSALIALAYSGTAFVIAGAAKNSKVQSRLGAQRSRRTTKGTT